MSLFYSDWFYEKLPLGFNPKKEPKDEAEKLALRAICNATADRRISVKSIVSDLTKAAEMGYTPAWYMLGWLYQYQPPIFIFDAYFGSEGNRLRNYKKAEEYYKTAVEAGEKNALYGLATLCIFGSEGLDYYHGRSPLEGLKYMTAAAKAGVGKAMASLGYIFYNDIYADDEQIQFQLEAIANNRMRDESVLRYSDKGTLVFDPDALHLVNFSCIYDEILASYWLERFDEYADGFETDFENEPQEITQRTEQALLRLREYEREYLAHWKLFEDRELQGIKAMEEISKIHDRYYKKGDEV